MSDDAYATILRDVLDEADRGDEPRLDALRARHPGHEHTVERVFAAFSSYRNLRATLASTGSSLVDALAPGERLGDFEIAERIASGGMGVVYRARQLSLGGRMVAVKVVAIEETESQAAPRFAREALAVAALHHAHLAEIHGFGEERGMRFFAMRFVEGRTLRSVLEALAQEPATRHALVVRRAIVERISEIADALATVHAAGLVHRDVKPENIVLEGATESNGALLHGSAVLIDFGLVRRADVHGLVSSETNLVTPSYASPEQLLGRHVDARSDVFSLGVTLHDLLAARLPGERLQASAGMESIEALVPDIDGDLAAVVSKAVDPTARWRYANAAEFGADLVAWLKGRPVSARRRRPTERARRWLLSHPAQIARASLFVALGLAIAMFVGAYGRYSGYAQAARVARDQGDVRGLFDSLERIPATLDWLVLRDSDLVELARRQRAGDPILDIKRKLDASDFSGALYTAATQMRINGLDSDPLVSSFFIAALRDSARTPESATHAAWHGWHVTPLVARLMYERPDVTADDMRASAPLREAILETFDSQGLDPRDRLYLLSALSGCGRPGDAERILEWGLPHPIYGEEQRLAIATVERILRRAHSCGTLGELDREAIWKLVAPLARTQLQPAPSSAPFSWRVALYRFVTALALANDDRFGGDRVLQEFGASIDTGDPRVLGNWWTALAALRDKRAAPLLAQGQLDGFEIESADDWGIACALYGDEKTTGAARKICSARGEAVQEEFEQGLSAGEAQLRGVIDALLPDANTCLGAVNQREVLPALEPRHEGPLDDPAAARWQIELKGVALAGCAKDFKPVYARQQVDRAPQGYLRMSVFGKSELQLGFDVQDIERWHDRELRIDIQNGARAYYPYEGVVLLDIELNGTPLADQLLAYSTSRNRHCVDLPFNRLLPGPNLLIVRLDEDTTTTARFTAAEIGRKPQ
jgi:hypothetical protein